MAEVFKTVRLAEIEDRKREIVSELNEISGMQRFTVTMEYYIYAEDEENAIRIAMEDQAKQRDQLDNQATVKSVHVTPRGWTPNPKQIYPK